jgi:hypothetical protein
MTSADAETLPFWREKASGGLGGLRFLRKKALTANAGELRSAGQPMAAAPYTLGDTPIICRGIRSPHSVKGLGIFYERLDSTGVS